MGPLEVRVTTGSHAQAGDLKHVGLDLPTGWRGWTLGPWLGQPDPSSLTHAWHTRRPRQGLRGLSAGVPPPIQELRRGTG